MGLVDELLGWWTAQPPETRRAVLMVVVGMALTRVLGVTNLLIVAGAAWYLSTRLPTKSSFLPYFERWYKQEYFPRLAERLQHELDQRSARRRSVFDSLGDKIHAWIVGSTKGLQASFVYELLDKRVLFSDMYFCRFANINIGGRSRPSLVAFVGINDRWFLAPWHTLDFENVSILEEMSKPAAGSPSDR